MTLSDPFIPSPTVSALEVGPLTIHFYALCILRAIHSDSTFNHCSITAHAGTK